MNWPPLPDEIHGVQGPIAVCRVDRIDGDIPDEIGCWLSHRRVIQVRADLPDSVAWSTLWHEWSHAALDDTGVCHHLNDEQQEGVCEAWAAAQIAAMRKG